MASITTFQGRRCTKVPRTASSSPQPMSSAMAPSAAASTGTPPAPATSSTSSSSSSTSSSSSSTSTSTDASPTTPSTSIISSPTSSAQSSTLITTTSSSITPAPAAPPPPPPGAAAPVPSVGDAPPSPPPPPSDANPAPPPPPTSPPPPSQPEPADSPMTASATPSSASMPKPDSPPGAPAAASSAPPANAPSALPDMQSSENPDLQSTTEPTAASSILNQPQVSVLPDLLGSSDSIIFPSSLEMMRPTAPLPALASSISLSSLKSSQFPIAPSSTIPFMPSSGNSAPPDASASSESPTSTEVISEATLNPEHDPQDGHDPAEHNSALSAKTVSITAGAVSGAIALVIIVGLLYYFCFKRRSKNRLDQDSSGDRPRLEKRPGSIRSFRSGLGATFRNVGGSIKRAVSVPRIRFGNVSSGTVGANIRGNKAGKIGGSIRGAISRPVQRTRSIANKFRGRRTGSTVGLMEERDSFPQMTMVGAQNYRPRRSQSGPPLAFNAIPESYSRRDSRSLQRNVPPIEIDGQRPRSIESPGQIREYQMPWVEDGPTPVPKTLRLVNPDFGQTPGVNETNTSGDSYFGLQVPPRVASPALASHRRSVSLAPEYLNNPFSDSAEPPAFLNTDPMHIRNRSQTAISKSASSFYSVGSDDIGGRPDVETGLRNAPEHLARGIAASSASDGVAREMAAGRRGVLPFNEGRNGNPFADTNRQSDRSSGSSVTSSIFDLRPDGLGKYAGSSVRSPQSPGISPNTLFSTDLSRNASDANSIKAAGPASAPAPRASYDPFNYNPQPRAPVSKPVNPLRGSTMATNNNPHSRRSSSASGRSARTYSTASNSSLGSVFIDDPSIAPVPDLSDLSSEPGPTRPGTTYRDPIAPGVPELPVFDMLTPGPTMRSNFPTKPAASPSPSIPPTPVPFNELRKTKGISNDPFDLDRPEVLGYTPSVLRREAERKETLRIQGVGMGMAVQRSDSNSRRKAREGRRSSVQETGWQYLEPVQETGRFGNNVGGGTQGAR